MRILIVGAGAVGGYFGGRLLAAGRDVTFLVRARRAEELKRTGLAIRSRFGNIDIATPPVVMAQNLRESFDVVLLSCKAYDLDSAMDSFAAAVGPDTAILPLLNGMRHLDALAARFGSGAVLGGRCLISAALDADGRILHLNDIHAISFGERDGRRSGRAEAIAAAFSGCGFDASLSESTVQEMWDKWVFIAAGASLTCLMRATVGDIMAAGGAGFASALLEECVAIARTNGFPPSEPWIERIRRMLTAAGSELSASMLKDMERGARIEADEIVGDLLKRGGAESPMLHVAYLHLKVYEARRARTQ